MTASFQFTISNLQLAMNYQLAMSNEELQIANRTSLIATTKGVA